MKFAFITLALVTSFSSFACDGEAQMLPSKVVKIEKTAKSCRVFVSNPNLQDNPNCPLDTYQLMKDGIEVGLTKDGACRADVNENVSGILLNKQDSVEFAR